MHAYLHYDKVRTYDEASETNSTVNLLICHIFNLLCTYRFLLEVIFQCQPKRI